MRRETSQREVSEDEKSSLESVSYHEGIIAQLQKDAEHLGRRKREIVEEGEREKKRLDSEIEERKRYLISLETSYQDVKKSCDDRIKKVNAEADSIETDFVNKKKEFEMLTERLPLMRTEMNELSRDIQSRMDSMSLWQSKIDAAEKQYALLTDSLARTTTELATIQSAIDRKNSEIGNVNMRLEKINTEKVSAIKNKEIIDQDLSQANSKLNELKSLIALEEEKLKGILKQCNDRMDEVAKAESSMNTRLAALSVLEERVDEKINIAKSNQFENAADILAAQKGLR